MAVNGFATTNEDRVVITVDEYIDLIRNSQALDAIVASLLNDAELAWDKKSLRFDDASTCHVLSALCRGRYYETLFTLKADADAKEEEKKKNAENRADQN